MVPDPAAGALKNTHDQPQLSISTCIQQSVVFTELSFLFIGLGFFWKLRENLVWETGLCPRENTRGEQLCNIIWKHWKKGKTQTNNQKGPPVLLPRQRQKLLHLEDERFLSCFFCVDQGKVREHKTGAAWFVSNYGQDSSLQKGAVGRARSL